MMNLWCMMFYFFTKKYAYISNTIILNQYIDQYLRSDLI